RLPLAEQPSDPDGIRDSGKTQISQRRRDVVRQRANVGLVTQQLRAKRQRVRDIDRGERERQDTLPHRDLRRLRGEVSLAIEDRLRHRQRLLRLGRPRREQALSLLAGLQRIQQQRQAKKSRRRDVEIRRLRANLEYLVRDLADRSESLRARRDVDRARPQLYLERATHPIRRLPRERISDRDHRLEKLAAHRERQLQTSNVPAQPLVRRDLARDLPVFDAIHETILI